MLKCVLSNIHTLTDASQSNLGLGSFAQGWHADWSRQELNHQPSD